MSALPARLAWQRFAVHAGPQPGGSVPWDALWADGLALRVLARGVDAGRPDALVDHARATFAANVVRRDALQALGAALDDDAIPYVAIKGAATLVRSPSTMRTRAMSDLDVLVSPRDFVRAQRVARALGYDAPEQTRPLSQRWTCEVELRRRSGAFVSAVDLHRGLHHGHVWRRLAAEVLARKERVDGIAIPSTEDALLVVAAHRARHAYRGDLREVSDAWGLLEHTRDASPLVDRADALHVAGALWALLETLRPWGDRGAALQSALAPRVPDASRRRLQAVIGGAERWTVQEQAGKAPRFASMYGPIIAGGVPALDAVRAAVTHAALRAGDKLAMRVRRS